MSLLASLAAGLACIMTYLSSTRQQLLNRPLPKPPAWAAFIMLVYVAIHLLRGEYGGLIASLIVLMLVMCLWLGITFLGAHLSKRVLLASSVSLVLVSAISLLGGQHAG